MTNISKISTIVKMAESSKFGRFATYFFEKPISITEVEKVSGITRQTIYTYLKKIEKSHLDWIKSEFDKEHPLMIKIEFVIEYFSQKLNLTEKEKELLTTILKTPEIERFIRERHETITKLYDWSFVNKKVVFLFIEFDTLKNPKTKPSVLKDMANADQIIAIQKLSKNIDKETMSKLTNKMMESNDIIISFTPRMFSELTSNIVTNLKPLIKRQYGR